MKKYPSVVKCFQIATYAIDARNRYFSVQRVRMGLLWNRAGFLPTHQKLYFPIGRRTEGVKSCQLQRNACSRRLLALSWKNTHHAQKPPEFWERMTTETRPIDWSEHFGRVYKKHVMITIISCDKKNGMYMQEWYAKCCTEPLVWGRHRTVRHELYDWAEQSAEVLKWKGGR